MAVAVASAIQGVEPGATAKLMQPSAMRLTFTVADRWLTDNRFRGTEEVIRSSS